MPSHHLFCLCNTSIYAAFNADCVSAVFRFVGTGDSSRKAFFLSRWVFLFVFSPSRFRFRSHLTICFACVIHQSMPHLMRIVAVGLDLPRPRDSSREAFLPTRVSVCWFCSCTYFVFRCLLTINSTYYIHQSNRTKITIKEILVLSAVK